VSVLFYVNLFLYPHRKVFTYNCNYRLLANSEYSSLFQCTPN